MVGMAVRQQDVGHTFGNILDVEAGSGEGRIVRQKRIDQYFCLGRFDTKSGMAEPGDLHWIAP